MQCDLCKKSECSEGKDCLNISEGAVDLYEESDRTIHRAASSIEAEHYMKKTRVEELILFSREMGYKTLGVAFCKGLFNEARVLCSYLRKHFKVYSVCCKVCGTPKDKLNLPRLTEDRKEVMCNPLAQARALKENNTDLNITVGLCIGHDILFNNHSHVSVTALIVKDRVLAHNPAGALYTGYYNKILKP